MQQYDKHLYNNELKKRANSFLTHLMPCASPMMLSKILFSACDTKLHNNT